MDLQYSGHGPAVDINEQWTHLQSCTRPSLIVHYGVDASVVLIFLVLKITLLKLNRRHLAKRTLGKC